MRPIALLLVAALAVSACSDPNEHLAQRIRDSHSELIQEVVYRPANILDPPRIDVFLRPGVTEAQAEELWCEVVVPAGASHLVALWADGGNGPMMAIEVICSTPAPS